MIVCSRAVPPATADHVIGVFPREGLSSALASTHRAGFGPQTRVIDGTRGGVGQQLERAGLRICDDDMPDGEGVLIVVTAPGRVAIVADLFARLGAERVVLAERPSKDRSGVEPAAAMTPDIRIGNDEEIAADA